MSDRRVVITGIGVVTPVGNNKDEFWKNLVAGQSGIQNITAFDTTEYGTHFGGEAKGFDPKPYFSDFKDARRADRFTQLAMAAAKMSVADSGLEPDKLDVTRVGVMVGSGIGGLMTLEDNHELLLKKHPSRVSPFTIPMMISNIASGMISMEYGFLGPNMCIVTACATSNHCIGEAWRIIKFGDADVIVAGGAEASISPMGLSGFGNMKALSTRNDAPEKASRPFDKDRDGFVMGEGSGVVILEEYEHAKKRGAHIYCELAGYGLSADAYHLSAPLPDGSGAARCMNMALKHAKLNADQISYVNAHATSTPVGDVCETQAIKKTFGDYATNGLLVSATKSMTGHLLGAAGGVELAASILAIRDQIIPPTINVENQDPAVDLDVVPNVAREAKVTAALSNSFGFGGHNAAVLVTKI
ncbi:beta-ketoacyl-ACP synthase II [Roseimicrobium sp. ORNL1]|uniref:beta-ketoacyl-ACP synthase II n=1 Tax=Roseimicrobium sp. ORNL1 TaxID=2711231 RepID=UPI0013E1DBCE|nr:beta-ketoacyl-ACP synthase II [Roseimicrobium sp. ORNL1]QIF03403.1 beta-ketoacyl-ACP synthase II [Roseimicrobium sp. ORNL1]